MTHEHLADKLGPEYACGAAYGIERGLILANLGRNVRTYRFLFVLYTVEDLGYLWDR